MDKFEQLKLKKMSDEIAKEIQLSKEVYEAFLNTKREEFVPMSQFAYTLQAQPIGGLQWISSPLTVARMTMALDTFGVDKVLEIGCGSGYQAAILSKLVHRVFSIERIGSLANEAKLRFEKLGINNVHVRHDDGSVGWSTYAPFDRILLSCAPKEIPYRLLDQLAIGGILVAPLDDGISQNIIKITKQKDSSLIKQTLQSCLFVPLLEGKS